MNNKKIAVLLTIYNGEKYIIPQLRSILNQTIKPTTLYVSIDKSNDNSLKIIKDYSKKYKVIKLVSYKEKFRSSAKNFFSLIKKIDSTDYDYFAFSDQDDIWKKNKIERSIRILDSGYDGYSSNVLAFYNNGKKIIVNKNQEFQKYDHYFESPGPLCSFVINQTLYQNLRILLLKNNFIYDKFCFPDWLIYFNARSLKMNWFIDHKTSLYYRQHSGNFMGAHIGFVAFFKRLFRVLSGNYFSNYKILFSIKYPNDKLIYLISKLNSVSFFLITFNVKFFRRRVRDRIYFLLYSIICILINKENINSIKNLIYNFYKLLIYSSIKFIDQILRLFIHKKEIMILQKGILNYSPKSFYFDFSSKIINFGDRLFFFPLIKSLNDKKIKVYFSSLDLYSQELFFSIYKIKIPQKSKQDYDDIVVFPIFSLTYNFFKYKKFLTINFLDKNMKTKISFQLIKSFNNIFNFSLPFKFEPLKCQQKYYGSSNKKYVLFSNYIISGFFRKDFNHDAKFINHCIELKKQGFDIIHIGTNKDKSFDSNIYPFVDIDLRGNLSIKELVSLIGSPNIHCVVSYDNFIMHLANFYNKKCYVVFRGRYFKKNSIFHYNYVNNVFNTNIKNIIYL